MSFFLMCFFIFYSLFSFIQLIILSTSCFVLFFISPFEHVMIPNFFFFLMLFFLSRFRFPESLFPLSSLHRSTRAQRVSSGLLVYVILFFN